MKLDMHITRSHELHERDYGACPTSLCLSFPPLGLFVIKVTNLIKIVHQRLLAVGVGVEVEGWLPLIGTPPPSVQNWSLVWCVVWCGSSFESFSLLLQMESLWGVLHSQLM